MRLSAKVLECLLDKTKLTTCLTACLTPTIHRRKAMVAVIIAFTMTFFNLFNIPVFWPILLIYFITLFALTMRRQIQHMIKYRYLPCSRGKKRYVDVAGGTPGPTRKNAD